MCVCMWCSACVDQVVSVCVCVWCVCVFGVMAACVGRVGHETLGPRQYVQVHVCVSLRGCVVVCTCEYMCVFLCVCVCVGGVHV